MLHTKLGLKIITMMTVVVVITLALVGYITFSFSETHLERMAVERYAQLTSETINHIDKYLFERERSALLLAGSHTPKHFLTELDMIGDSPAHPIDGVVEDLDSFGFNFTVWSSVLLVDAEGVIRAASHPDETGKKFTEISSEQYGRVLTGEPYISNFEFHSETDSLSRLYVLPVKRFVAQEGESQYVGAVVAYLPFSTITDLALSLKHQIPPYLSNVTGIALISKEDEVLFSDGITGYVVGGKGDDYLATHTLSKKYTDEISQYIGSTPETEDIRTSVFRQKSQDREEYSSFGGTLSLELDADKIYEPVSELAVKPVLYLMLPVILLGILIFVLLHMLIIRPICSYIVTMRAIKEGKVQARAKVYANDELGQMAQNFNDLTDQQQRSNLMLERQVRARTEELQLANSSLERQVQGRTKELKEINESLERRVSERTKELEKLKESLEESVTSRTKELHETVAELKTANQLMVNRELKMVALKEEIKELKRQIETQKSEPTAAGY